MILVLLYLAVLVAGLMPHSTAGRALRRLLVDMPRAGLAWLTPGKLLLMIGVALIVAALIVIARADVMLLVAQGLPEGIGWFVTFDVATYLDVVALAWLLAATVRLRALAQVLRAWAARVRRVAARRSNARSRRMRRPARKPAPKASDDDGGGAWAYA
jgi:hypothetical protein